MSVPAVQVPMVEIPERQRGLGCLKALDRDKAPLPLAGVSLKARVIDRVAEVHVEQKFHNPYPDPIEAVYVFPLAGGCAVSKFEMQVGARIVKGKVEERGEARRQYTEAIEQGKRAALLEQERDDVFTVQVGNITPGEEITVRLTYSERLPFFENGDTELRLPTVVAPRYVGGEELAREQAGHGVSPDTTTVPDASRITPPRLAKGFDPKVSLLIEAELFGGFADLESSQHAVRSSSGPESARVQLSREREPLDRDFVLRWKLAGEKVKPSLLVHGEYAMLSLLPPAREGYLGTPRDVVFVVDRSGSMGGPKMASAARACALLLRTLGPRDRFAVQAFDNVVEWMPGGFTQADEGGIDKGEKWLREISARGGTEIDNAMSEALAQVRNTGEGRVPVIVVLTDGEVGDESSLLKRLQTGLGDARVFTVGIDTAVNDGFLKRVAAIGGGTCTFVEPGARLEEALQAVGREIGAPVITDLKIKGEIDSPAPSLLPDLFAGRASAAFFRFHGGSVKVTGKWSDGGKYEEELEPREAPLAAIDHLWARARVVDLEDQFRISHEERIKNEIIAISVKHTVLTRFTAFVAVDEAEIVNQGGKRRTVVQPVEMPAEWAMQAVPAGLTRAPRMPAMAAGMPPRAMAALLKRGAGTGRGLLSKIGDVFAGSMGGLPPLSSPPGSVMSDEATMEGPDPVTPAQRDAVRQALEELVQAFALAHEALKAGKLPDPKPLKEARMKTMEALKLALELATLLSLLQRFLRSDAVDLIAALAAGGATAAGVLPLFDKHAAALQEARDEARKTLLAGKAPAGSFWEASI